MFEFGTEVKRAESNTQVKRTNDAHAQVGAQTQGGRLHGHCKSGGDSLRLVGDRWRGVRAGWRLSGSRRLNLQSVAPPASFRTLRRCGVWDLRVGPGDCGCKKRAKQ